jgi:hypothetical protein
MEIGLEKHDAASHHLLSGQTRDSRDSDDLASESTVIDRASPTRRKTFLSKNIQWITIVVLQLLILLVLVFHPSYRASRRAKDVTDGVETGGDINGLYKTSESSRHRRPQTSARIAYVTGKKTSGKDVLLIRSNG